MNKMVIEVSATHVYQ